VAVKQGGGLGLWVAEGVSRGLGLGPGCSSPTPFLPSLTQCRTSLSREAVQRGAGSGRGGCPMGMDRRGTLGV
jgi:hypothetical protein